MVRDINEGSSSSYAPSKLTAIGNTLFFVGFDAINGYESGKVMELTQTVMLKDIYTGTTLAILTDLGI